MTARTAAARRPSCRHNWTTAQHDAGQCTCRRVAAAAEHYAETLVGQLTRPVLFTGPGPVTGGTRFGAGTEVYATLRRDGLFALRIPGTLLTMDVHPSAVEPV